MAGLEIQPVRGKEDLRRHDPLWTPRVRRAEAGVSLVSSGRMALGDAVLLDRATALDAVSAALGLGMAAWTRGRVVRAA